MLIRQATAQDLDDIMRIYDAARQTMRACGNATQWVNGYPQRDLVAGDIERRECYVAEGADGRPHAAFMFAMGDDPTYAIIEDGSWLNDKRYGVIHRIGSDGALKGVLSHAVDYCLGTVDNLRIDTHADNVIMHRALSKKGFERCGIIYCQDGTPRVAYQLDYGVGSNGGDHMGLEMTLEYRLRYLDFDRNGRIHPVAVLDLLQDVATLQAETMGIGHEGMLKQGVFWALIRLKYEVVKPPERFQLVRVRTWPHSLTRFSFQRDFTVSDEAGNTLVKATSEWVLMDIKARKFVKMSNHYDGPTDFLEDRSFDEKPRKIPSFDEGTKPVFDVVPTFSDIDVNGHVNNARYPRFVMDALDPDDECAIRTFQIDYRHEVLPGAPLSIHTLVREGSVLAKGVREDGETAFTCLIELD